MRIMKCQLSFLFERGINIYDLEEMMRYSDGLYCIFMPDLFRFDLEHFTE